MLQLVFEGAIPVQANAKEAKKLARN